MITFVTYEGEFAFVAAACVDGEGAAVDPESAEAVVYEVSQLTGGLFRRVDIGNGGVLTLSKCDGQTGFFGASVDTALLGSGQYLVLFRATIGGVETIGVDQLFVDVFRGRLWRMRCMRMRRTR